MNVPTGMDWLCPGYSQVLAKQLGSYHGNITAVNTVRYIVPIVQTGDLHIAVYDLYNDLLYVANARADSETGPDMAYDRYIYTLYMYSLTHSTSAAAYTYIHSYTANSTTLAV